MTRAWWRRGRWAAFALLTMAAMGCRRQQVPDGIRMCPLLVLPVDGTRSVSYGGVVSRRSVAPWSCVEIFDGERRIAHTFASADGTFALLFLMNRDADGAVLELRITDVMGTGAMESMPVQLDSTSESSIAYDEGTVPLAAYRNGTVVFDGRLDRDEASSTPIESVWMANWTTPPWIAAVTGVEPTPAANTRFVASFAGAPVTCASPIALHTSGETGGCWWPAGGGGCTFPCTVEDYLDGTCPRPPAPPCTGGRGCAVIDVDARSVVVPPPERPETVPVPPPDSVPFDGGVPDAPPDAPAPDVREDVVVM